MSKKKNFTQEQKHLIKQCMIDAEIMGLGKDETIVYVKSRLGLVDEDDDDGSSNNDDKGPIFSEGLYKKFRGQVLNDNESNVQWISYYTRQGFVEFYRKRIAEMEMIQKETLQQWHNEMNKPDSQKNKNLILKLVAELRANNQHLTSLGMVTPIIATIKNIIDDKGDKDKTTIFQKKQ
ncbi:MAG: hypothetical protein ACRD6U_10980 [Nitrososphaeraceae archaeon]